MRSISISYQLSVVVCTAIMASLMQRDASPNWPSSAYALVKYDKNVGIHTEVPVARHELSPEVIARTASEALPVVVNRQPWTSIPPTFQNTAPFSFDNVMTSSNCAF